MLQAKLENGNSFTLVHLTKEEIEGLRKKQIKFYCPVCNQSVLIKAGSKMIPHFAHYSSRDCPSNESGEGKYHEKGKLLLYNWLKHKGLDVSLEEYIPSISQRPDFLLTIHRKRIAFEYQCARIPPQQIQKRNQGYISAGITPIWILGANRFERKTGNYFKLDSFTQQFIHQFSSELPSVLYYFCPHTLQFISIQDIFLIKHGQAIGNINVTDIRKQHFKNLFTLSHLPAKKLWMIWGKEKERFRLRPRKNLYGNELAWHQWLYLKGSHIEYLPSIVYLPISAQYRMKSPLWDWQSRICLEVLEPMTVGSVFTLHSIESLLRKSLQSSSVFPLIRSNDHPIKQYLQLLADLGIIKKLSNHTYQKAKSVDGYQNIEQSLKGDKEIINQLKN
ncbi:competence protein CoiA [Oceanobacillus salinisoli]|uniref:competence protein CoiA n=1 Tax=Oceanobacillus salinisoli TaxID=2678611 RepID=UPI0012E263CC|nr:competence protein CoiA family protein [Oceanobacillus salinisoli]